MLNKCMFMDHVGHQAHQRKARVSYRKAKSLIEKIERMLEDGVYCVDIMQQNLAVMGLLRSAHRELMTGHLSSCFKKAMETGDEKKKQAMIAEILQVTHLVQK